VVAEEVAGATLGAARWRAMANPFMGAEDFSRVLQRIPGAMLFLGASTTGDWRNAPDNHSAFAGFDDGVLPDGAALLTALARATFDRMSGSGPALEF
jgi:metal-dependent amidase/aminoacylase/carboxypeptidase family protein